MCPFSLVLSQSTTKNSLVLLFFFLCSPDKYLHTWIRFGLSLFFFRLKAPALSLSLYDGCSLVLLPSSCSFGGFTLVSPVTASLYWGTQHWTHHPR